MAETLGQSWQNCILCVQTNILGTRVLKKNVNISGLWAENYRTQKFFQTWRNIGKNVDAIYKTSNKKRTIWVDDFPAKFWIRSQIINLPHSQYFVYSLSTSTSLKRKARSKQGNESIEQISNTVGINTRTKYASWWEPEKRRKPSAEHF